MKSMTDVKVGANLQGLGAAITGFVVITVTAAVGSIILGQFDNLTDTGGSLENADANTNVSDGLGAVGDMTSLFGVLAIVIIAAYILNLMGVFGR